MAEPAKQDDPLSQIYVIQLFIRSALLAQLALKKRYPMGTLRARKH